MLIEVLASISNGYIGLVETELIQVKYCDFGIFCYHFR